MGEIGAWEKLETVVIWRVRAGSKEGGEPQGILSLGFCFGRLNTNLDGIRDLEDGSIAHFSSNIVTISSVVCRM